MKLDPNWLKTKPWETAGLTREEWEAMMKERYPDPEDGAISGPRPEAEMIDDPRCWEKF